MLEVPYTIGLDLAQASDYTALCVLETQLWLPSTVLADYPSAVLTAGWNSPATMDRAAFEKALTHSYGWPAKPALHLRHLERMRGKPYPEIVEYVAGMLAKPPFTWFGYSLVVDATGVGAAVVDLFRQAGVQTIAITIHGGDSVTRVRGGYRVPKRDLVAATQSVLQTGRLVIAEELKLGRELRAEMQNFKVTIDPRTAHDSYSHWRERDHDDLVLATALAAWFRDIYWRNFDVSRRRQRQAA